MAYDPMDDESGTAGRTRYGIKRPRWLIALPVAILLLLLWPSWVGFYTEWLWFREVGYAKVFSTTLLTKLGLGAVTAVLVALLVWLNFKLALGLSQSYSRLVRYITVNKEQVALPDVAGFIQRWVLPISLLVGLFFGLSIWESWEVFLQYRHQTPFGEADPIFGRDIAYYVFTLPLLELIAQELFLLVIVCLIGAGVFYVLRGGFASARQSGSRTARRAGSNFVTMERAPRRHLLGLVAAFFLVLAWRAYLETPGLLFSTTGPVAGASYTDVAARLPLLRVEIVAALVAAALVIATMFRPGVRLLVAGVAVYLLAVIAGWIYPYFVQRFSVAPNELVKETPYILHNVNATRKAFALDRAEERELTGDSGLTQQDIQENKPTINNVRLWDRDPLLDTFAQLQEIRTYYQFQSVDNDRYRIGGELRQTMISPRELAAESLPNRNWINERLTFTHGFGLTLGPVNQVTPEGLPVLFIKDLPPVSTVPALSVTRPEIYYGELSHDPVYVKTATKEFDYPAGDQNVYTSYAGAGGVSIGSSWRRLLFATRFGDMKLLLSNDISSDSRVLYHRTVGDRLGRIAPFLRFDRDPYLVISEGRLFWIADAYTISDRYPYSEPIGGINYIRNSVKAVVDAYDGSVRLYLADPRDPLIQTWAKIFPGIIKPLAEMPADLRAHLRYPEDIFNIQTAVYSTYHMDQPQVFYNKEDQWETATVLGVAKDKPQAMVPYYMIMKLPGERQEEFILMLPFTPRSKDNLASWMVARSDGENYGRLLVYRFPKQKLVYGPKQVEQRINQDTEISRQISLWDQRGSRVTYGTLLVIPIKESLVYVQPLYLRAESGKIPELKRVIVVAENRIAMEETLEASLARIFGSAAAAQPATEEPVASASPSSPPPPAGSSSDAQGLAAQAKQHYDRAIQAQREGDWARYGEEIKRLGAVLEQMSKQR